MRSSSVAAETEDCELGGLSDMCLSSHAPCGLEVWRAQWCPALGPTGQRCGQVLAF